MRSALTNSPVASFTTQLLRVTQHATGLMVKVALLLPSRDLLSSQRQLRWTHTSVWLNGGRRKPCFSSCNSVVLHIGLDIINLAKCKSSTLIYKFNFGLPGRTEQLSPTSPSPARYRQLFRKFSSQQIFITEINNHCIQRL